ncbi:hypothetical protein Tco_1076615 [Tanacetum coccineum]
MLVQPTEDEGEQSERPSEPQLTPSPPYPSEVYVEPQSDLSPRPSPTTHILDSIPEDSDGDHGGHSSSDRSLSGNEGGMTLQSMYDLCISLCTQVIDQAKEIKHLKAQIKKLKKKAKPVITHHRAWMKSGRKSAKAEPTVHKDEAFDELDDDAIDNMETEDAQDMGRTRYVVNEEKEREEKEVSTEDVVSTDKEKVSTDRSRVSTDKEEVSTDRPDEGTVDQTEGRSATPEDDEHNSNRFFSTWACLKQFQVEKEKGVELKDIEEDERPGLLQLAEKKVKQLASDEENGRRRRKRAIYNRRKSKIPSRHNFCSKKFLAQQRSEAIRNRPPTKNKLRNQMMTYLKHVGNFKHSDLKTKKFKEIQALYEKIKMSDEDFIAIGFAEDERLIKEMNEKWIDSSKNESVKEEDKEEEDDDSDDEHRKCFKIVTFEATIDSEIMEKKSVIAILNKVSSLDGDYLVIYRANRNFRAFNYLMEDRIVIHILVERRYPLSKDLLQRMLDLGLEVERESSVALDLIRFIKQQIDEE